MFCVKCGRDGDTIGGLCAECFLDGREIAVLPHHIDLERCTNCEEFLIGGTWRSKDLIEAVQDAAFEDLAAIPEARITDVRLHAEELDERNFLVSADVSAETGGIASKCSCSTAVRIKNTVCKRCSRQLGNYYEATLQIRTGKKDLDDDLRDEIVRRIRSEAEHMAKNNRQLFITKVTEVTGGIDMLMSSISMTKTLARSISDAYGAEFKESSKLVGKTSDGADMYRLTYLVRIPEYCAGDIVMHEGEPCRLVRMGKNGAKAIRLADFREHTIKSGDLKNIRVVLESGEIKEAAVVSVSANEIQIVHPANYLTIDLRIPPNADIGDTVNVAIVDGDAYYVP